MANTIATKLEQDVSLVPSLGEELAGTMVSNIESDMLLTFRRRAFATAQRRVRMINTDFARMLQELEEHYSETEAVMIELYVQGCRTELLECYLAVNHQVATTPEGRATVAKLVDELIDTTVAKIKKPEVGKSPVPLGQGRKSKSS